MNIRFFLSFLLNVLSIETIDPEIQLCEELSIDAAVIADDNIGYAFKDNFYWIMETSSGISSQFVAKYISDRWIGLTGPINAVFTIHDSNYELSTVFIKGNQWFLYKKGDLEVNGTTDNWPYVFKRPMMSAFEYSKKYDMPEDISIYLMYGNDDFSKYIFRDINSPTHVHNGKAYRKGRFLNFLNDPSDDQPGTLLSSYIEARAVMSDENVLVIYGDKELCFANITAVIPICNKTTDENVVSEYYGCPRKPLPTTTTIYTTIATSPPLTSDLTTNKNVNTVPEDTVKSSDTIATTEESFVESESLSDIQTDTTISMNDITESQELPSDETNEKKSNFWTFVIIIVLLVIICLIILFFVFNRKKNCQKTYSKEEVVSDNNKDYDRNKSHDIDPQKSDKTLKNRSQVSIRSNMDSDESLGTDIKQHFGENSINRNNGNTTLVIEADQMLDSIKSDEDIE